MAGAGEAVDWDDVTRKAEAALDRKEVVGVPLDGPYPPGWLERLLEKAGPERAAVVLPVRVDRWEKEPGKGRRIYLLAGEPLKPGATLEEARPGRGAVGRQPGGLGKAQEGFGGDGGAALAPAAGSLPLFPCCYGRWARGTTFLTSGPM